MQNFADRRRARTWVEVDLAQAERNALTLRRLVAPADVMAVVKADAYGHGAAPVAGAFARAGITRFGVASLTEALALRRAGIGHDIHVLSPFLPEEADALVRADVVPMISSDEQWRALARAARDAPLPARCFLKVDTGMGRSGCLPDEGRALLAAAARDTPQMRVTGIATHFSSADEPDPGPSEAQARAFGAFLRALPSLSTPQDDGRGERGVWLSSANSPAALRFPPPETAPGVRGVLVRAGLLLYGIEPFREALDGTGLMPVLSWKARVTLVRELPAGATVGYGRTHTLARPSRVATLAAGYADGLSRRLSGRGEVLLRGRRLPLLGRVSMDQCQFDATDAPEVTLGDVATLIGTDGGETQTVLDLAERIDTTPHEPTCTLSQRVARIYSPPSPV